MEMNAVLGSLEISQPGQLVGLVGPSQPMLDALHLNVLGGSYYIAVSHGIASIRQNRLQAVCAVK